MVAELRIEGAAKFGELARELRKAGDKDLRTALYRGINSSVKPLSETVKRRTPEYLPRRYAAELAKTLKVKVKRRGGRDPSIRLMGQSKTKLGKERDLRSLNRGRLRHPLYGNRRYWYDQKVAPNWWDDPLLEEVDQVREVLANVLDDIGARLAAKM